MKPDDLDAICVVIAKHAPTLRDAGVTNLAIGDVTLTLAPPVPEEPSDLDAAVKVAVDVDPLEDPDTYGGHVPGFPRPQRRKERDA